MVAIPTNYKMGTGLAATIMGQQAGLEAEQQGLANLVKGMQMPAEALKGQEAAMLMNDPQYLQQKTQNTLIELKNTYSAQDFQQTLDAANRVRIRLDAAGGDPAKEQQIVQESLSALKIDPNSEFAQYAMKDPRGALTKFIQGVEVGLTGTGGAKQFGKMAEQTAQDTAAMARLEKQIASNEKIANIRAADTGGAGGNLSTDKEYNKQLKLALAGDENAKRWVNTYIRNKQITNLQYGAPAFQFGQGGGAGQMTTKGATAELPFPDVSENPQPVTVTAGGKVYSFPNQAAANAFKQKAGIQ